MIEIPYFHITLTMYFHITLRLHTAEFVTGLNSVQPKVIHLRAAQGQGHGGVLGCHGDAVVAAEVLVVFVPERYVNKRLSYCTIVYGRNLIILLGNVRYMGYTKKTIMKSKNIRRHLHIIDINYQFYCISISNINVLHLKTAILVVQGPTLKRMELIEANFQSVLVFDLQFQSHSINIIL